MAPHPDLRFKTTDRAMLAFLSEKPIVFAFRLDDDRWEVSPIDAPYTVYDDLESAKRGMVEWARAYAWAHTTLH